MEIKYSPKAQLTYKSRAAIEEKSNFQVHKKRRNLVWGIDNPWESVPGFCLIASVSCLDALPHFTLYPNSFLLSIFFFSSVTVLSVLPYYSQPTLQSPLLLQLQVQQQAALMASVGQGGYLSPMAAFAAAQMQHMATINGLPGAPLTPTSGNSGLWSEVKGLWWLVPSTTEMAFRTVFTFTNFFWSKS